MSLRTKLAIYITAITLTFVAALTVLQWMQSHETKESLRDITQERSRILEAILKTTHRPLYQLAYDYSYWGEMVDFATKPTLDLAWAKVNVDEPLQHFTATFGWVLRVDLSEVYRSEKTTHTLQETLGISSETLQSILAKNQFSHFFAQTNLGLIELQAGPLQPSEDAARKTPPQGWYIIARLWDEQVTAELSQLTGGNAHLCFPGHNHKNSGSHFGIKRALPSWKGEEVSCLWVDYDSPILSKITHFDGLELRLMVFLSIVVISFSIFLLKYWVLEPLQTITTTLRTQDASHAEILAKDPNDIGQIAKLARDSLFQKKQLIATISQREQAEAALKQSIREREQLGRDLHDGIIQRIYATGLTLETTRSELADKTPAQALRIQSSIELLNAAIRELRQFIAAVSPETNHIRSLNEGIQEILQETNTVHHDTTLCSIDGTLARQITPDACTQLLLITREALSNAYRHSGAKKITVSFASSGDSTSATLTIHDNGCGFHFDEKIHRGRGLDNIIRRAEEIGASAEISSKPNLGTTISIEIPLKTVI